MRPSRLSLLHSDKFFALARMFFAFSKSLLARASWNSLSEFFLKEGAISDDFVTLFVVFRGFFPVVLRLVLPIG